MAGKIRQRGETSRYIIMLFPGSTTGAQSFQGVHSRRTCLTRPTGWTVLGSMSTSGVLLVASSEKAPQKEARQRVTGAVSVSEEELFGTFWPVKFLTSNNKRDDVTAELIVY